jgi:Domain of unknown function (DUF2019)
MVTGEFDALDDDALGERFRSLMLAYDEACMAYDHAKAAVLHREFYAAEDELRRRRGEDDWRRTGLEVLSLEDVVARFKERAIAYEGADGSDETEHLYWDLEGAKDELQRRPGDQRRALFSLYFDADIRVRQAAAEATRTLAPLLSQHRLSNIDDDDWVPPASGVDIEQAGLQAAFPTRSQAPNRLKALSVEQLTERFVGFALGQHEAELHGEIAKYNRLYDAIVAVKDELKSRPGDQRRALVPLFVHPNAQVRLVAAQWAMIVAPVPARQVLQDLSDRNIYPQAADARLPLRQLDRGESKLMED